MSPLEEATTDDLIAELRRRLPHLIVCGEGDIVEGDDPEGVGRVYGHLTVCLGLHRRLRFMLDEMLADDFDVEEEEE